MAETEQRRLDVEATLKGDGFATGAKQIETSSQTAGAAAVKLSDIIRKTGEAGASAAPSLSRTGDSVEKLKRTLIDGYAAAQKAEQAINGISKAMAAGNLAGDELTRSIDGVIRRYGILAAESVASAKGTLQNAAAVEILNTRLKQQAAIRPAGDNDNSGQFRRQNVGYQALDIGTGLAGGMPIGMILAQQGPQIAQLYATAGGAKALAEDAKAVMAGVGSVARSAYLAIGPIGVAFIAASAAATAFYFLTRQDAKTTDEVLQQHRENIKALGDAYGIAEEKVSSYSVAERAMAEAGTRSSTIDMLAKQKDAIEELRAQFGTMVTPGKSAGSFFALYSDFSPFKNAFDQLRKDADVNGFVEDIKRIGEEQGIQKQADKVIVAAKASADLNRELEKTARLFREISNDKGPGGFLLSQGPSNRDSMGDYAAFLVKQRIDLERVKATFDAQVLSINAKSPAEKANAARVTATAQFNDNETPAIRAQRIELAGKQALIAAEHELQQAREQRQRSAQTALEAAQFELSIVGKTAQEQARLRAEYEAAAQIRQAAAQAGVTADQAEIAAAQAKASALAAVNQQIAAGKLLREQGDQIRQLQLEASLIGATAQERARSTAAFQAEQAMRQQGIDLMSREADQYRANAVAIADARLEIERQSAAYAAAQQAGGQLIDQMFVGTGSIEDRLKSMANTLLTTFQQLAVANPLKNALTGSNLPTLSDLFSGRPSMPGATSTAMMTVTAGTVMLNGGLPGLPGLNNGGGLGELLGYSPANQNMPSGGIADYIKQAALKRGIDPATALRVAQSEGGLESWNLQSRYMKNGVQEQSFGPFQLYKGGGLGNEFQNRTGLDPALAQNGPAGVDFALDHAQKNGWSAWNGAKRIGLNQWDGIDRSAQAANQNLLKLSSTTTSAANDIGALGQSSFDAGKSLTDVFGQGANTSLNKFPAAPQQMNMPTQTPGGGNFFTQLLSSLFGFGGGGGGSVGGGFSGAAGLAPSSAELVSMPRVSHAAPNYHPPAVNNGGSSGRMKVDVGVSVDKNGNLQAYVRNISHEVSSENTRSALDSYDQNHLPGRMKQIANDPHGVG